MENKILKNISKIIFLFLHKKIMFFKKRGD
jgi:hypothetical protein